MLSGPWGRHLGGAGWQARQADQRLLDERFWRSQNPHGVRRAGNYHRTLATYLNSLLGAGFAIERVAEPAPAQLLAEQQPEYVSLPIFWATRACVSAA